MLFRSVARVQVTTWHTAYAGLIPAAYLATYTVPMRAERWEAILTRPGSGSTLVGEMDGTVEGFVSFGIARDGDFTGGELAALYVHPTRWATGLGHALHESAIAGMAGRGDAMLWVLEANTRARSFYERHGWRPDGVRKVATFAGEGVPEVRLRRTLPA